MLAKGIVRSQGLAALGLMLCAMAAGDAKAGVLTASGGLQTSPVATATLIGGGSSPAISAGVISVSPSTASSVPASSIIAPVSGPAPLTGFSTYQPASRSAGAGSAPSSADSRGVDEKWGDPLNAGIYDSDSMHAGFSYYYGNSQGASQGGIGFSLTFKN